MEYRRREGGEGGGITTNNEKYVERIHSLRNHGCKERYFHDEIGYNYRMGGLEGASLSVKLDYDMKNRFKRFFQIFIKRKIFIFRRSYL